MCRVSDAMKNANKFNLSLGDGHLIAKCHPGFEGRAKFIMTPSVVISIRLITI